MHIITIPNPTENNITVIKVYFGLGSDEDFDIEYPKSIPSKNSKQTNVNFIINNAIVVTFHLSLLLVTITTITN